MCQDCSKGIASYPLEAVALFNYVLKAAFTFPRKHDSLRVILLVWAKVVVKGIAPYPLKAALPTMMYTYLPYREADEIIERFYVG